VADGTIAELAAARTAGAGSNLEQIFLQVTGRDDAEPAPANES
jgi:hypothetical protein